MKEPHFDDRRVIQRAQPVVPLGKIRARRLLFLCCAFVIAMMLGSAAALLTVRVKQRSQVTQVNTAAAPEPTVPEVVVAEPTPDALPAEETSPTEEEVAPPVKPVVTPRKQQPEVAQRPRMVDPRANEVQPSEGEQLQQIREAVLYEQWQERRMRRVARRERRNRGDRDISHVDEIFEGPRRPDRP